MLELKDGFVFYHGSLETHIFENADVDWLHCIAAHRKKKMFIEVEREMARYDIIAGKIADDATTLPYCLSCWGFRDRQKWLSMSLR